MPAIIQPQQAKVRALVYGVPKTGKTRLVTSLPWGPFWGEKALYCAWDPGSESLSSVRRQDRERLVTVVPTLKEDKRRKGHMIFDPHDEAHTIATRDWTKEYPDVGTIIWDTMTETAELLLRAYANTGVFVGDKGDKHITVGEPGTDSYMALPMMGDYGTAQLAVVQIVNLLFTQPLHVLVVCHADIATPDKDEGGTTVGGPATVGAKGIARIAGKFDNLFRTEKRTAKPPAKGLEYKIHTEGKGIWLGGMRTEDNRNPMPEFVCGTPERDIDPADFWREIQRIQYGAA